MSFSIQKLYQRSITIICVMLTVVLLLQLVVFSFLQLRSDYRRELQAQANMIAREIEQSGIDTAKKQLTMAKSNPQLIIGCVFGINSDAVIAARQGHSFKVATVEVPLPATEVGQCTALSEGEKISRAISARAPVLNPGLPTAQGQVFLAAWPPSIFEHFGLRLLIFLVTVAVFIVLFGWLGMHLRRTILSPIHTIATTAQRVSMYKDYSLRVSLNALQEAPKEILLLIDSFNAMLKEIEDRDGRLMRKTEELEKAREKAEAANVTKSQFLANVSHELRTPLNAIIGFSAMIRDKQYGALDEKYVEYANDIHDSGKHLLDVINDIIDLSQADSGTMSTNFESLSLHKVIERALHIVAGQAQIAKVDIYTDIPEKLPKIVADRVRLVQILLNLLSNAIKYTPGGGKVVVRVQVESGQQHVHFFTVEVEDSGIGMTQEEIAKVFTSFNQADMGLNRKYEGIGLGLPLTKKLVELHHGRIKIESEKGRWTRVSVRLTSDPALLD